MFFFLKKNDIIIKDARSNHQSLPLLSSSWPDIEIQHPRIHSMCHILNWIRRYVDLTLLQGLKEVAASPLRSNIHILHSLEMKFMNREF